MKATGANTNVRNPDGSLNLQNFFYLLPIQESLRIYQRILIQTSLIKQARLFLSFFCAFRISDDLA